MSGIIKQNKSVYGYDAYFDETENKWYGEVWNKNGKTVKQTKAEYSTFQDAIQSVKLWIAGKLDRSNP